MPLLTNAISRLMVRTRISHKLLLASSAAILPLSILLWFVVAGFGRQIAISKAELGGLHNLEPLQQIAGDVTHHNRLTLDLRRGGTDRSEWDKSVQRMDQSFQAAARNSSSAPWFPPLQAQWTALRGAGTSATAASLADQHARLFRGTHDAMREIGDDSGLVLDPDLDSYYLVDIITHRLPAVQTIVNDVAGIASRLAEDPGESAANDWIALRLEAEQLAGAPTAALRRSVEVAIRGNKNLRGSDAHLGARLPQLMAAYDRSIATLVTAIQNIADLSNAPAVIPLADDAARSGAALWKESLASATGIIEQRESDVRTSRLFALALTTSAVAFALFLILRVSSMIGWSLGQVVSIDGEIAGGELARARERLDQPRVRAMLAIAASGNGAVRDELLILLRASESMTGTLDSVVQDVNQAGARVNESVHQIAAAVVQLEATISEQAASTNEVSSTSTEILATARDLARTVETVSRAASETATSADAGLSALQQIHATMDKLTAATEGLANNLQSISAKTRDVDEVITAITKVANRTNLLSLNAAIEAERGSNGTGAFSIVSLEIRKLADQTAASALDIEALIKEMQSAVQAGVTAVEQHAQQTRWSSGAVNDLSSMLAAIIQNSREVAPQFETVNSGMQAQAHAAGQISNAIAHLRDAAQQTRGSVEGFQSVAGAMRAAAGELERAMGRFSGS
jgi:methyl-accepting chemotaxis protein